MGCGSSKAQGVPQPRQPSRPPAKNRPATSALPSKPPAARVTAQKVANPTHPQVNNRPAHGPLPPKTPAVRVAAKKAPPPGPPKPKTPVAYRVERDRENEYIEGLHFRRHSSIQQHLDKAPVITDAVREYAKSAHPKKYPKEYHNKEKDELGQEYSLFVKGDPPTFYEYISNDFPYAEQNNRGKIKDLTKDQTRAKKGYTRTITDRNKNIKGVIYHPFGDENGFRRAQEVHS